MCMNKNIFKLSYILFNAYDEDVYKKSGVFLSLNITRAILARKTNKKSPTCMPWRCHILL